MTTKTVKTILFASVIAAMIVPISGTPLADAIAQENYVAGPEPEIQVLLDRAQDPNTTQREQQQIKKELNALGVPTKEQLDKDPESWTQKIFEKAQKKLLKEQKQNKKTDYFGTTTNLQNNENTVHCPTCPPNDNMAFWSGFYYDCGKSYMCSAQVTSWKIIAEGNDDDVIFFFSYPQTDVQGWYYAQAPNGSTNVQWNDIYVVLPTGFDEEHSYNQDADPMKFKLLERVNNNGSPHQISFNYDVISVT